jgi:hypothetical protein
MLRGVLLVNPNTAIFTNDAASFIIINMVIFINNLANLTGGFTINLTIFQAGYPWLPRIP